MLATVAAIRRTLDAADLDLHDLARGISADLVDMATFTTAAAPTWAAPPRPQPTPKRTPAEWAEINRQMQEAEDARRAKLAPWPTFKRSSHFAHCTVLERVAVEIEMIAPMLSVPDRAAFRELRAKIHQRPQELLTRKEMNLFNRISKALWTMDRIGKAQAA